MVEKRRIEPMTARVQGVRDWLVKAHESFFKSYSNGIICPFSKLYIIAIEKLILFHEILKLLSAIMFQNKIKILVQTISLS